MIIKPYIQNFEEMGFGMFVHFGIYSVLGKGEWAKSCLKIPHKSYEALAGSFCPKEGWAKELAAAAKSSGAKYITLTTRHHDGFSLYDTQGLSEFDAPHFCGRDLIREFTDACREYGIRPFFYHTLVDWHNPDYYSNFPAYLSYLRSGVKLLCTNYGAIGGIWFDGTWDKPQADWEEDSLYRLIRTYQPEAMIINNTGMDARGALGHPELDSVTFEQGKPHPIHLEGSPKYIAREMCRTMNDHWGYASSDVNYKSVGQLIAELAECRRYGANYLLNVGPKGDGTLRLIDRGILEALGLWVNANEEAIRKPRPTQISIAEHPNDFLLCSQDAMYLFVMPESVQPGGSGCRLERFPLHNRIQSVRWLDNGQPLPYRQEDGIAQITALPFDYGTSLVVRVAKITLQ